MFQAQRCRVSYEKVDTQFHNASSRMFTVKRIFSFSRCLTATKQDLSKNLWNLKCTANARCRTKHFRKNENISVNNDIYYAFHLQKNASRSTFENIFCFAFFTVTFYTKGCVKMRTYVEKKEVISEKKTSLVPS